LNGIHGLLVITADGNLLGKNISSVNKNKGALFVTSKEVGQKANAEKTKYQQNAGRSDNIKTPNKM
jgi:hypothetical protein